MKIIGAVDIGGSKTATALVREDGIILDRDRWPTAAERGVENTVQRACDSLRCMMSRCMSQVALDGIGIACPGPLDPFTGVIGEVGTLPGWRGRNLIADFRGAFDVPVVLENDADAAALAEVSWGAAKGSPRAIYVTVSTGIGGGIVFAGELYRGAGGAHPEIGHLLIDGTGPLCYCGSRGCWESLASGVALAAWVREQQDCEEMTASKIFDRARLGDSLALHAVEREAHYLGIGLSNLITAFIPDTIVLGGGVMRSSPLLFDRMIKTMHQHCTQVPSDRTRIVLASLGADSGVLGACCAWLRPHS